MRESALTHRCLVVYDDGDSEDVYMGDARRCASACADLPARMQDLPAPEYHAACPACAAFAQSLPADLIGRGHRMAAQHRTMYLPLQALHSRRHLVPGGVPSLEETQSWSAAERKAGPPPIPSTHTTHTRQHIPKNK